MKYTLALALATAVSASVFQASNVESFGATLDKSVAGHSDAIGGFDKANVLNLYDADDLARRRGIEYTGGGSARRQAVPADGTPDPNRNITTPDNIFVLQCDLAGFQGDCLVFGAGPGKCVGYESFNSSQAFLDQWENKTSSISTNTGGNCQFYKFRGCNNKGDDRGVTINYNYNLAEVTEDYGGDYDNQISSWRC